MTSLSHEKLRLLYPINMKTLDLEAWKFEELVTSSSLLNILSLSKIHHLQEEQLSACMKYSRPIWVHDIAVYTVYPCARTLVTAVDPGIVAYSSWFDIRGNLLEVSMLTVSSKGFLPLNPKIGKHSKWHSIISLSILRKWTRKKVQVTQNISMEYLWKPQAKKLISQSSNDHSIATGSKRTLPHPVFESRTRNMPK
jgi:hypothetical protein